MIFLLVCGQRSAVARIILLPRTLSKDGSEPTAQVTHPEGMGRLTGLVLKLQEGGLRADSDLPARGVLGGREEGLGENE